MREGRMEEAKTRGGQGNKKGMGCRWKRVRRKEATSEKERVNEGSRAKLGEGEAREQKEKRRDPPGWDGDQLCTPGRSANDWIGRLLGFFSSCAFI